ncbi:metallophosphoesterase family protein [Flavobacterium psychrophilum]|uniref:metallophosphoesterase family protein n=1 Tax=Flavobacterium psychrophilum TaxID=96345 RepID=UPI0033948B27
MRKFVISDIHGCYFTFEALLDKIEFSKNDELILLGDYINRGKRSKEVIDKIIDLSKNGYNVICLRGNHEDMVFDSLELEDWTAGEQETLKSFGINHLKNLNSKYVTWFKNLLPYYESENFIFVHAGLNFKNKNPFQDIQSMRWIIDWYKDIDYSWLKNKYIIHGHKIIEQNEIEKMLLNIETTKILNIDNGCFMKDELNFGNLNCLNLSRMEIVSQKNID